MQQISKQTWRLHASAQVLSNKREAYLMRVKWHRYFPVTNTINDSQSPEVYTTPTQHPWYVRSLSGSASDRDQKRNKRKNVTRRVQIVECQKETSVWYIKGKWNHGKTNWMTRALEVSTFFIRKSWIFGTICPNYYQPTCSVNSNPNSYQQNAAEREANRPQGSRLVDMETLTEGLKECSFCHCGKYSLFFTAL